jgi:hypothetical protein
MSQVFQNNNNYRSERNPPKPTTNEIPNPLMIPKDQWINPTQFRFTDEVNLTLLKAPSIVETCMHQINATALAIAKLYAKLSNLKSLKILKATMIRTKEFPPHIINQVKIQDLNQATILKTQLVQNEIRNIDDTIQDLFNEEPRIMNQFYQNVLAILTKLLSNNFAHEIITAQQDEIRQKISDRIFFYSATFEHNREVQKKEKAKKQITKDKNTAMEITTDQTQISVKEVDKLIEQKLKALVKISKNPNKGKNGDNSKSQTPKKSPPSKSQSTKKKKNKKPLKSKGKSKKSDF